MSNILIPYIHGHYAGYPQRATIRDHLYAFARYADGHQCGYLNLAVRDVPAYVKRVHWDVIIFPTTFLASRWKPRDFQRFIEKIACFRDSDAVKVILPQDEFVYTDLLVQFIRDFNIRHVFSVAPPSEWPKIYHTLPATTTISQVLTGYLDDRIVTWLDRLAAQVSDRPIDIGYRSAHPMMWLGRHGQLKWQIGDIVAQRAPHFSLVTDISTRPTDTILGDAWYTFLMRCKYFLGVEGGASILDRDGTLYAATQAYLAAHPHAEFAEVEAVCFPERDGTFDLRAISPRHFEACATRTCQILIEGDYNGILRPGEHYIALKKDFSNLDDVLQQVNDDWERKAMTERAYRDIVASGQYTYRAFVQQVLETALGNTPSSAADPASVAVCRRMRRDDHLSWCAVASLATMKSALNPQAQAWLRRVLRRG